MNKEPTVCACKGCRSCLECEFFKQEQGLTTSTLKSITGKDCFFTFHYLHPIKQCVTPIKKYNPPLTKENEDDQIITNVVGFNFHGVNIIPDFISASEEKEIIEKIDSCTWKSSQSGRRKQDYGPKVNFKKQKIKMSTFNGLPPYIIDVVKRMQKLSTLEDFNIVEQCNLEYDPARGSQIDPHFDDDWLWGERLVTLNLLSDTYFTMTCCSDESCDLNDISLASLSDTDLSKIEQPLHVESMENLSLKNMKVKIPLQKRSLVVLSGTARHKWKHAIERKDILSRRVCCTFRELSDTFKSNGDRCQDGDELLSIASTFEGTVVV